MGGSSVANTPWPQWDIMVRVRKNGYCSSFVVFCGSGYLLSVTANMPSWRILELNLKLAQAVCCRCQFMSRCLPLQFKEVHECTGKITKKHLGAIVGSY